MFLAFIRWSPPYHEQTHGCVRLAGLIGLVSNLLALDPACSRPSGSWRAPAPISVAPPLIPARSALHVTWRVHWRGGALLYTLMALSLWVLNRTPGRRGRIAQARRPSADRLLPRVAVLCLQPDESSAGAAGQYRNLRDCGLRGLVVVALLITAAGMIVPVALWITIATVIFWTERDAMAGRRRRRPTPSTPSPALSGAGGWRSTTVAARGLADHLQAGDRQAALSSTTRPSKRRSVSAGWTASRTSWTTNARCSGSPA